LACMMTEIEQITYFREKKPPSLAQFLVRKATALASEAARGQTGTVTTPDGRLMPRSAKVMKDALPDRRPETMAALHPEWVQEYEEKYGGAGEPIAAGAD